MRVLAVTLAGLVLTWYAIGGAPRTFAVGETVSVGSLSVGFGHQGTVSLAALNSGPPGLGAWEIDVMYDSSVVAVKSCVSTAPPPAFGVCNPALNMITIRDVGATASGLLGTVPLADIAFTCNGFGTTALAISIVVLADATIGNPQPINAATQNGYIQCFVGDDLGGVADYPDLSSGSNAGLFAGVAAAIALAATVAAAWYARRRWVR